MEERWFGRADPGKMGVVPSNPVPATPSGAPSGVPAAQRSSGTGWRDPRLWIGVALVAASVLVGVRVLASADDTVAVWAVAGDVGAGDHLEADDLVATRVRFTDDAGLDHYLRVEDELPADLAVLRALGAGELLPRSALGSDDDADTVEISLPVAPLRVPPSVGPGSVVDVYVADAVDSPGTTRTGATAATPEAALSGVSVVDAPLTDPTLGATGERQVVLAVPAEEAPTFFALLDSLGDPVISIARH